MRFPSLVAYILHAVSNETMIAGPDIQEKKMIKCP